MSTPDEEPIVRIAARGDGITASGRFAAGAAPGDVLLADGGLRRGSHYVAPVCRHFTNCGGCQLQHCDEASLADFVRERVVNAALAQGVLRAEDAARIVAPSHLSPPASRRRASLHAGLAQGRVVLGYREGGGHTIVDLAECPVPAAELVALIGPLRQALARHVAAGGTATKGMGKKPPRKAPARLAVDVEMTLTDQGVDLGLKGLAVEGLAATEAWLAFAREHKLARLTLDQGYGPEALWQPAPVTVTLGGISGGGVAVPLPPGAFLQATADGEATLAAAACVWLRDVGAVADLFAGLGTFGFALARGGTKVLAVEADRAAHLACDTAARRAGLPMQALHRDLFRNPLLAEELNRFGGVLLDPPRAGAREQVVRLAASQVPRIVYISCNPASWARDAAVLVAAGWRLAELRGVGQFRWSTHVELASLFVRI